MLNFIRKMVDHIHKLSTCMAVAQRDGSFYDTWSIARQCITHNNRSGVRGISIAQDTIDKFADMTYIGFKQDDAVGIRFCCDGRDNSRGTNARPYSAFIAVSTLFPSMNYS